MYEKYKDIETEKARKGRLTLESKVFQPAARAVWLLPRITYFFHCILLLFLARNGGAISLFLRNHRFPTKLSPMFKRIKNLHGGTKNWLYKMYFFSKYSVTSILLNSLRYFWPNDDLLLLGNFLRLRRIRESRYPHTRFLISISLFRISQHTAWFVLRELFSLEWI